jgi:phage repressor protein C with HTH and peptisase S24 domain
MIGDRLKEERVRLKLAQPEFAEAAGAAKRTLIEWEKGTTSPNAVQLSALEAIGVDVYYVLTGKRSHLATESVTAYLPPKSATAARRPLSVTGNVPDGFIVVPRYEVQASAGNGSVIHSEQIVDYLAFSAEWIRNALGVSQKDLALISVKGDSMEPGLSNDDLILVDMRKSRVEDNAIYVLRLGGELLVKRIQRKLDGSLHVMSDNPRYEAEIISAERAAELSVLGRVVWSGRRM